MFSAYGMGCQQCYFAPNICSMPESRWVCAHKVFLKWSTHPKRPDNSRRLDGPKESVLNTLNNIKRIRFLFEDQDPEAYCCPAETARSATDRQHPFLNRVQDLAGEHVISQNTLGLPHQELCFSVSSLSQELSLPTGEIKQLMVGTFMSLEGHLSFPASCYKHSCTLVRLKLE